MLVQRCGALWLCCVWLSSSWRALPAKIYLFFLFPQGSGNEKGGTGRRSRASSTESPPTSATVSLSSSYNAPSPLLSTSPSSASYLSPSSALNFGKLYRQHTSSSTNNNNYTNNNSNNRKGTPMPPGDLVRERRGSWFEGKGKAA